MNPEDAKRTDLSAPKMERPVRLFDVLLAGLGTILLLFLEGSAPLKVVSILFLAGLVGTLIALRRLRNEAWAYRWKSRDLRKLSTDAVDERDRMHNELVSHRAQSIQELQVAREVQQRFLPETFPFGDRLNIAATYTPCEEIGGDIYDVFKAGPGTAAFYIADASGHGVGAALVGAVLKFNLEALKDCIASGETQLADVVHRLNEALAGTMRRGGFVTFSLVVMDVETGRGCLVNAGHNPPLVWRSNEAHLEEMEVPPNLALAILPDFEFEPVRFQLNPGDKLLLYTDGITERLNASHQEWGVHNLMHTVRANAHTSVDAMARAISLENRLFGGSRSPNDDQALIVVEYLARARTESSSSGFYTAGLVS